MKERGGKMKERGGEMKERGGKLSNHNFLIFTWYKLYVLKAHMLHVYLYFKLKYKYITFFKP